MVASGRVTMGANGLVELGRHDLRRPARHTALARRLPHGLRIAKSLSMNPDASIAATDIPAHRPLSGITVLDFTNVLAGPFAGYQLASLGARVIKIEGPDGDLARRLGADPAYGRAGMGISFLAVNAGKESIAVDLKHADGKALVRRMVRGADCLLENFRPGVMGRLGLDYAALQPLNARLVYW